MSVRHALVIAAITCGCENLQDLGSHAPRSSSSSGSGSNITKLFFVTDEVFTGALGGLAGADALCTAEARAANLGGNFRAWLSSSSENARDHIAPVGPWMMVDGSVVFEESRVTERPRVFPRYTARGTDLFFRTDNGVWTGTNGFGVLTRADSTCADWTSDLAQQRATHGTHSSLQTWTDDQTIDQTSERLPCSDRLHLYCFEQ